MIIQNSTNLNLIDTCHGEAHWACVGEQLFTEHAAAGALLFEVGDKAMAGDRLTWSRAPVLLFVTVKCLDVTLVSEYRVKDTNSLFYLAVSESLYISDCEEALRL